MPSRPTGADWSKTHLDRFETHALPALSGLPRQPFTTISIRTTSSSIPSISERIAGIIDFGDLTSTARVNDLAVAAAYQVVG